jgi:hypothetical protein
VNAASTLPGKATAAAPAICSEPMDTIALGQALADAATIGIVYQRALAASEIVAEITAGHLAPGPADPRPGTR